MAGSAKEKDICVREKEAREVESIRCSDIFRIKNKSRFVAPSLAATSL